MDDERFDPYSDVVGLQEVAEAFGVTPHCVRRWIERRASTNCPMPVKQLRMGHIWSMAEWRAWHRLWKATRKGNGIGRK